LQLFVKFTKELNPSVQTDVHFYIQIKLMIL